MRYFYAAANGKQLRCMFERYSALVYVEQLVCSVPEHNDETSGAWSTGHFGEKSIISCNSF